MAVEPRIASPRLAVVLEKPDRTLVEIITQTDNRDAVRWDMTRGRKNWPSMQDAPLLWMTFLAWSALARSGDFTGTFEQFNDVALSLRGVDADGNTLSAQTVEATTVGPTQSGLVPD